MRARLGWCPALAGIYLFGPLRGALYTRVKMKMKFEEKVQCFRNQLKQLGIRELYAIPFYYKLFWKIGIQIPPPYFNSFLLNTMIHGIIISLFWSFWFWLLPFSFGDETSYESMLTSFTVFFLLFGPTHAFEWHRKKKKWGFGRWIYYPDNVEQKLNSA